MVDAKVETSEQIVNGTGQEGQLMETDSPSDVWNEEQIEQSLKKLKEMYIQLRDLRSVVSKLTAPLAVQQPSPAILFEKFKSAAVAANEDLKQFRHLVAAEDSQMIFEHAKDSRTQNPKGIAAWRITERPDWYTKDV